MHLAIKITLGLVALAGLGIKLTDAAC